MAILFKNNASTVTVGVPTPTTHEWIRVASTDVFPTLSADNPSDYYMVTLVGDAPGGGACSAYGGYIAGGGGAGALGSLMELAEWATPGWANDSYTHPANAGAGQVGCVLIISTWAL